MFGRLTKFSTDLVMLINSQRKIDDKTRVAILPIATRKALVQSAKLAAERHLTAGTLAEISTRITGDKLAINIQSTWFPAINEECFTVASLSHDRTLIASMPPSKHVSWHRLAYLNTTAKTALLCQPVFALFATKSNYPLSAELIADAPYLSEEIARVPANEESISLALVHHHILMIQGIGLFIWGDNFNEILALAETVDHWCQISLMEKSEKIYD